MRMENAPQTSLAQNTTVDRLKERVHLAKTLGFQIRNDWLDGPDSTWCEVAGVKILFIDLSQPVADQLDCVNEAIETCAGKAFRTPDLQKRKAA